MDEDRLAAVVLGLALVVFLSLGGLFLIANDSGVAALFLIAAAASGGMLVFQAVRIAKKRS